MADSKRPNVLKVISALEKEGESPPERREERELDPRLGLLRAWQAERLSRTYADYLADERFRPACEFFLSDIYAPRDFSQRDQDFDRLHELLSRFLPEKALRLLSEAIALNQMTYDLDQRILHVLVDELGMQDSLAAEQYVQAYRRCNNQAARQEQIKMMIAIVREVGIGARLPLVRHALRLARRPALRWGWVDLYDFLERGYQAFQPIKDINPFVQSIEQREKRILEQIFSGTADPFQVV